MDPICPWTSFSADTRCPLVGHSIFVTKPAWRPKASPVSWTGGVREIVANSPPRRRRRSEEHTSELQSRFDLVCRLLLEKKNKTAVGVQVATRAHVDVESQVTAGAEACFFFCSCFPIAVKLRRLPRSPLPRAVAGAVHAL